MEAIARQGDTLDSVCWRVFGRTAGVTEAALEKNPHLTAAILAEGAVVALPDAPPVAEKKLINLWD